MINHRSFTTFFGGGTLLPLLVRSSGPPSTLTVAHGHQKSKTKLVRIFSFLGKPFSVDDRDLFQLGFAYSRGDDGLSVLGWCSCDQWWLKIGATHICWCKLGARLLALLDPQPHHFFIILVQLPKYLYLNFKPKLFIFSF